MTSHENSDSDWAPCQPGVLTRHKVSVRRRPSLANRPVTLGLLLGTALFAGSTFFFGKDSGSSLQTAILPRSKQVHCADVTKAMQDRRNGPLDEELERAVAAHIAKCQICGPLYQQMLDSGALPPDAFQFSLDSRRISCAWHDMLLANSNVHLRRFSRH